MGIHEIALDLRTLEAKLSLEFDGEVVTIPIGCERLQDLIHTATLCGNKGFNISPMRNGIVYYTLVDKKKEV